MDSTTHPTRSLPERADLDQLKRQAKDLLRAAQGGDPGALERLGVDQHPVWLTLSSP